jgi:hypothetical protein
MGQEALVENQIAESIALVKALDASGAAPVYAGWYFYDDANEWRFLIAGPAFDALLPKHEAVAYRKIVDAISGASLSILSLSHVKILKSDDEMLKALRSLIHTGPDTITRAHVSNTTLNGVVFIKDMFILRSA